MSSGRSDDRSDQGTDASTSQPGVSVVIPTFDRAQLLGRALDSVLEQTRPPAEIVVVDDGSADDTPSLVRARYPQVRLLQQSNRGVSAARNLGIKEARHEWIALLDSDDEWRPHKLERQLDELESRSLRICHCNETWIRRGNQVLQRRRHEKRGGWLLRDCLPLCAISPSAAVIHRQVFDVVGFFDESLPACEDYDLWLRVCSRYEVAFVSEELVVKYGGHDDQLSRRYPVMDEFRIRALRNLLDRQPLEAEDRAAVIDTLREKVAIVAAGARKRGLEDRALAVEKYLDC